MGSDADMEDYGFEYSDEEPEEQDVDIENQYYNSKGLVETDPEGALAGFAEVVRMEPEKAEWGFKALKQTVKLYYRLGKYKEMMDAYREMLTYIKSAVTRNYSEKCINNIMDFVSGSASQNFNLLQEFYQTTLKALEEAKNERLWFKTNLKLCKIWLDMGEYERMNKILKELHKSCQREDGSDDQKKGTQLLEVYAIEIQMYTETKNNKKLKCVPGLLLFLPSFLDPLADLPIAPYLLPRVALSIFGIAFGCSTLRENGYPAVGRLSLLGVMAPPGSKKNLSISATKRSRRNLPSIPPYGLSDDLFQQSWKCTCDALFGIDLDEMIGRFDFDTDLLSKLEVGSPTSASEPVIAESTARFQPPRSTNKRVRGSPSVRLSSRRTPISSLLDGGELVAEGSGMNTTNIRPQLRRKSSRRNYVSPA